jgi:signal transduction histidine kinase
MTDQCHIRIKKDKILKRWEELSREMLSSATDKSRAALRDHIPQLMDALCDVIETGVFEKPHELSQTHGQQRFSFGDYSISQILTEYWLLKRTIFDELEIGNEIRLVEFRTINQFFESAATTAASEFSKLREIELIQAARTLEASNLDLKRFAAVAAHDLKSPSATIIGYADLGIDDPGNVSADSLENFKTIKKIGLRMIQLVDRLLEYSQLGESNLVKKRFFLSKAAEEAKSNLANEISQASAEVKIGILPEVEGDPVLFTQLFQNLISNSLKFKSDKRTSNITISGIQDHGVVKIQVKDNGLGFDPKFNQEIFEPFKRGDNSENIKGSGLGLATVHKIIELHGGKISALGWVDEGAEFNIEVPQNSKMS